MTYIDYSLLYNKTNDGIEINMPLDFEPANCIITGNDIFELDKEESEDEIFIDIQKKYGITFFSEKFKPEISIYCVPYLQLFASDKDGIFGLKFEFFGSGDFYDSKIYYCAKNGNVFFVAENITAFIDQLCSGEFNRNNLHLNDDVKIFSSYSHAVESLKNTEDNFYIDRT